VFGFKHVKLVDHLKTMLREIVTSFPLNFPGLPAMGLFMI